MDADNAKLNHIGEQLNICQFIRDRIDREIDNDPPLLINKGRCHQIRCQCRAGRVAPVAYSGKDYLLPRYSSASELTEIPSLKIGYNNVFGYYIEVRNTHKDKVPAEWIRKQTLANAERYITQELKEYEEKILGAEDKILVLETQLYAELVQSLSEFISCHSNQCEPDSTVGLLLLSFAQRRARTTIYAPSLPTTMCWKSIRTASGH